MGVEGWGKPWYLSRMDFLLSSLRFLFVETPLLIWEALAYMASPDFPWLAFPLLFLLPLATSIAFGLQDQKIQYSFFGQTWLSKFILWFCNLYMGHLVAAFVFERFLAKEGMKSAPMAGFLLAAAQSAAFFLLRARRKTATR